MQEIWKVYKETNNNRWGYRLYEVSNYGNVKCNGKLVDTINTYGYPTAGKFHVHRAVAELFIPNPEHKPCVDHIDTNPNNNNVENLRWVTYKENNNNPLTRYHNSISHIGTNRYRHKKEQNLNHSKTMKGRRFLNDGIKQYYVKPEYWGELIDIGYKFGKI